MHFCPNPAAQSRELLFLGGREAQPAPGWWLRLPLAGPTPEKPQLASPAPRLQPGPQLGMKPAAVPFCGVHVRLGSACAVFGWRPHLCHQPMGLFGNRPGSPAAVALPSTVPGAASRRAPFLLEAFPQMRPAAPERAHYRKKPAAMGLEQARLRPLPALFCGASGARSSICACLACNTPGAS